ncbi:helix-turn-helix domain-containing protein [Cellulomonas humilata]|uniref:Transcriptional regulator with XRE-family HTH domain n=1 Tax=Cellulomonas humilata TaxID=144055 RepID=A0ABU0EL05_9CELL|nr:helix-turn-helix transcriptional regulator [Cellulomonas humilata]MDQ0375958.1 transcriptional regulator with XRE-family HTH domain [Cellulomonas humilata]
MTIRARNTKLEGAMHGRGLSPARLAEVVGVDLKTVERWVFIGRVPRVDNQWAVAQALGVEPSYFWAASSDSSSGPSASITLYPHRGAVPADLWQGLVRRATASVRVLVYAGLPFFENDPGIIARLRERADEGIAVRLAFGDPDCPAVLLRGQEEGIDMAARVRNALHLVEPLADHPGVEVRLHDTTLYASQYLAGDEGLINHHILGVPAARSVWMHLRRTPDGFRLDDYGDCFEKVWAGAHAYR